ncbi:hypothetical protein DV735_g5836, partial [Chaetothyriales sp. CBS 134920]
MAVKPRHHILFINGPNLNLLGTREPEIYGSTTLAEIEDAVKRRGAELGISVSTFQSKHEGGIIDRIHAAVGDDVDAIVINPAAYTHTSVAIRDALLGVGIPFVECHITNVHAREAWRHQSYFQDKAQAVIAGLGPYGYIAALQWWAWKLNAGSLGDLVAG